MAKKRVYELARELKISSKEFIERAKALGYTWIQSHANSLEDREAAELLQKISLGGGQPKPKKKTVLRRRAVKAQAPSNTGVREEYQVIVTRLSDAGEKVIERKRIEVPVPTIQAFTLSEPVLPKKTEMETASTPDVHEVAAAVENPAPSALGSQPEATVAEQVDVAQVNEASQEDVATVATSPAAVETAETTESDAQTATPSADTVTSSTSVVGTPQGATAVEETTAQPTKEAPKIAEEATVDADEAPIAASVATPKVEEAVTKSSTQDATTQPNTETKVAPPLKKESSANVEAVDKSSSKKKKSKKEEAPAIQIGIKFEESLDIDKYKNVEVPTPEVEPTVELPDEDEIVVQAASATVMKNVVPTTKDKRNNKQKQKPARKESPRERETAAATIVKKKEKKASRKSAVDMNERGNKRDTKKRGRRSKKDHHNKPQPPVTMPMSEKKRVVKVDEAITLGNLAHQMGEKASKLIRTLLSQGIMATINQALTVEEATALAKQFGYEVQDVGFKEADVIPSVQTEEDTPGSLVTRPPVVTVMGHVDHGKTSLLDAIRETRVTASEAGGITQHIGAYEVRTKAGGHVVFLDTPGHEAFTSMRSRGAQATDIVILVVAADDGIMPQTVEAISHSKAAGVPIIVAVNKIDKQGADPQRVRYDLLQHDLISEELGGDVQMVNVSAHTKEGIPDLLEQVALLAEIMELQANPDKAASGVVIESHIKKGRGPVATILVSEGTLKAGDTIVAGMHFGRIRAMFNDQNKEVKEAGPSIPVEVIGLSGTPEPGERFDAVADERDAKQIIEHRRLQKQRDEEAKSAGVRGWSFGVNEQKELNIILKADTQGTLEALKQSLGQLKHDEIKLNIPLAAVGGITESDVNLASTTNSVIFGFHVRAGNIAQRAAESEGVEIRVYRVIYELLDTAKQMMEEQLTPVYNEKPIGQAEIRKTFNIPKAGRIAGCYVTDGKVTRGALIRLYREDVQIYEGRVATLRRFKDDVKEVATGFECGIQIEGYQDIRPNDIIEAYEIEEIAQKLELL